MPCADVEQVVHFLFSGKVESPIIAGNARDAELALVRLLDCPSMTVPQQ